MTEEARAERVGKTGVIELTPAEITTIDLVLTRERMVVAEEKLAAMQLRDAQLKLLESAKSKAALMAQLGMRVGGKLKHAKVMDRQRLAYELE